MTTEEQIETARRKAEEWLKKASETVSCSDEQQMLYLAELWEKRAQKLEKGV
jgi:hypothetical protein